MVELTVLEREVEESMEQRGKEKIFKWKEKIKTFHLTSIQVLVLVKIEMQIQIYKY